MGLTDIPRQIAGFPEFRRAMLFSLRPNGPADAHKISLNDWRARQPDDLGVMLLEMWAYICDSLSFYDKVISQEEYLRTALRRPSLRKLVGLLGYLPTPASGSTVYLAALAEGRALLKLPAGTAFRSTGFNGNPPQVFELEDDAFIHPFTNKWTINAPQPAMTKVANPVQFLVLPKTEIKTETPLLFIDSVNAGNSQSAWVSQSDPYTGNDGKIYRKILLNEASSLPLNCPLVNLKLYAPLQSAGLWTIEGNGPSISPDHRSIVLDGLQRQIKTGQYIIIARNKECRWYQVTEVHEITRKQSSGDTVTINSVSFPVPPVTVPVTKLTLDRPLNDSSRKKAGNASWNETIKGELTVHFIMQLPGTLTDDPKTTLSFTDPILFKEKTERPLEDYDPKKFFLSDKNIKAAKIGGQLDYAASSLQLYGDQTWSPEFTLPVEAFGNIIKATRGEKVPQEILGSGNAAIMNQTFKLKKKLLTYFAAGTVANDQGVQNTLLVYVNGVRWTEVPGFFNRKEDDEIYIVRQDDEGDSFVTFGDGIRGKRLPSGTDNIIATYRFGAGLAAPPAAAVTQISKPVVGLTSVNNPLAASGGDDAETAEDLATHAPKSILTLGRIVSIQDINAVALTVPGVRSAQVEWRWHGEQQCPLVHIWYIGEAGIEEALTKRLRSLSDPSIIIHVEMAMAVVSKISIDVQIDPRYVQTDVLREVKDQFMNEKTGLLIPENIGIGRPLFRSKIFATAVNIAGVSSVRNVQWNDDPFTEFAKTPGAGRYFDFENGELVL